MNFKHLVTATCLCSLAALAAAQTAIATEPVAVPVAHQQQAPGAHKASKAHPAHRPGSGKKHRKHKKAQGKHSKAHTHHKGKKHPSKGHRHGVHPAAQ